MRSYQGKFKPINPDKYLGDVQGIIFRSNLERRLMMFCDTNPDVLEWASEEFCIRYVSPVDRKEHRYFPDFFMKIKKKDDTIDSVVIEVKPHSQCFPPKQPKKQTRRFIAECQTYVVNQAKWAAAKKFCDKHGFRFEILTEKHLNPRNPKR